MTLKHGFLTDLNRYRLKRPCTERAAISVLMSKASGTEWFYG